MNTPTQSEINEVLDGCLDAEIEGSKYPSMNYEQGVDAAIRWMQGEGSNPLED